jgi:hypothetical protein
MHCPLPGSEVSETGSRGIHLWIWKYNLLFMDNLAHSRYKYKVPVVRAGARRRLGDPYADECPRRWGCLVLTCLFF